MRIDILTLFPDAVDAMMHASILGRAQERGYITIRTHQIRNFTTNKQMQVDDYPYGGGRGAVMQADPLYRCWAHVCEEAGSRGHTIYLSPCGRTFTQSVARELKKSYDHLILVCGHYEGIDQRFIDECVDEEISMGDFVVTGGEIPAMALADAVCRMVLHGGIALERSFGVSPVFPPRRVAWAQGAGRAALRSPRQRGEVAAQAELHPHDAAPPRPVGAV